MIEAMQHEIESISASSSRASSPQKQAQEGDEVSKLRAELAAATAGDRQMASLKAELAKEHPVHAEVASLRAQLNSCSSSMHAAAVENKTLRAALQPVSYTHLTLPTKRIV
eukprot:TRINITY_DN30448_c0_g1_i1.p2 TRINITY_DN30448_c0_g1~~TRINITY_DN30448_c0_g1_i1.p2  ORF type:complete len:111 (+),score=37.46 TRINITY_DN30448_c0_g1_i1:113-445(+)